MLLLLLLVLGCVRGADFSNSYLKVSPARTQIIVELEISFKTDVVLNASDRVWVQLPKVTSGRGTKEPGADKAVHLAPSIYFEGTWREGEFRSVERPFLNSTLELKVRAGVRLERGEDVTVKVYKTNELRVYCGFDRASNTNDPLTLRTNATLATGSPARFDDSDVVGNGCSRLLDCLERGTCDYCTERCACYEKLGDGDDISRTRSYDCSLSNCPTGLAWVDVPDPRRPNIRREVECSNAGVCETQRGECACFDGFTGDACQRRTLCIDASAGGGDEDCAGRGACVTMRETARVDHALPLTEENYTYGVGPEAWDADAIQHCVCDSSWEVGLDPRETQSPEYFGPRCSLKRCPTGDDPATVGDETDCTNVTAAGGQARGQPGNKCHVECSNRGTCDYAFGRCTCFSGFYGAACDKLIKNAGVV
ncbi:hypothetical protein CTAYLR_005664 [Chrysophaeum taylorii]|uniref:EGF-like domain-containing protein n=1 Tax=Chrysophaeum taylorii TaxID=2483200 RepID=A0AAD7UM89_9STRA|nr:hypothetical protein CTAYLR_005664 [Chrysophaeum taylorii]